jgi:membrane fusion protein
VTALSLFRQEALEFQQQYRQWGQVAGLQPFSTKLMTWCVSVVVTLIIVFIFVAQYSRKETVVGYLTPTTGTAKIFTPQHGAIKQIFVKEGENVRQDEPLLTVETSQIAATGVDVNASVFDTLSSQKNLLLKQIDAEEHRTISERERLTSLISGMETEISYLLAQTKT